MAYGTKSKVKKMTKPKKKKVSIPKPKKRKGY